MNFTLAQVEVHALVGSDAVGIHLGNPFHLDDEFFVQTTGFLVWHTMRSSYFLCTCAFARICFPCACGARKDASGVPRA